MLKRIHFQNWRSLRDVTVEFGPITVLIGANSSGKTNIVDGLRLHRDSLVDGILDTVMRLNYRRILSYNAPEDAAVAIALTSAAPEFSETNVTDMLSLKFDKRTVPFDFNASIHEGADFLAEEGWQMMPPKEEGQYVDIPNPEQFRRSREIKEKLFRYYTRRWQILTENFLPEMAMRGREGGDRYVVEPTGRNVPLILELMGESYPDVFQRLLDDAQYVLGHIRHILVSRQRENQDLEISIDEAIARGIAPTVSAGTVRALTMLVAMHALDMPQRVQPSSIPARDDGTIPSTFPGLVVIEEPDTALNPGILERFVEVLRKFTEGDKPRQVILTTHNPTFLSYFKPEEVRVVERDEHGDSHVYPVRPDILDNLETLKTLSDVWLTHALGGIAE